MKGKVFFVVLALVCAVVMFSACGQKQEAAFTNSAQNQPNPVALNNQKAQPAKIAAEGQRKTRDEFIRKIKVVFGKESDNSWEKELFVRSPNGIISSVQQDYEKVYAMDRLLTSPLGIGDHSVWNEAGISEINAYVLFKKAGIRLCKNMLRICDLPMDVREEAVSVGIGEGCWNNLNRADEHLEAMVQIMKLVRIEPEDLGLTTGTLRNIAQYELRKEIRYFKYLSNVPPDLANWTKEDYVKNAVKYGVERWNFTRKELGV